MRPLVLVFSVLLIISAIGLAPHTALGQVDFNTNTPQPTDVLDTFSFATNTPPGPTATNTPTATATATNTPTPTPIPLGPYTYPTGINPLTGLPYPSEEAQARRNLIVKISNFPPEVRPQSGVNAADLVYEYEVEGGVTRFAAIFRNNAPEHVGPIRSARLLDMELVVMYRALLAYSGTSEPIQNLLLSQDWRWQLFSPSVGYNCEQAGFCRFPEEGKAFEHTLYGDTNKIWEMATLQGVNTGYRAYGFAFDETPTNGGEDANELFINWWGQANALWQYDPETERYVRFTDGVPHYDAADGEQLWADNLIIVEAPHNRRPDLFPEGANYESLEIALWDGGRALVARNGRIYQGFWQRPNRNEGAALMIINDDGTPIMLKPGRSWVSVVRGLGIVDIRTDYSDMAATATVIAQTPTPTASPQGD